MELTFSLLAWVKLNYFMRQGNVEVGAMGRCKEGNPLYVEDLEVPKQTCTIASIDFDMDYMSSYMERICEEGKSIRSNFRVWIHTHPSASCTPSGTDEDTFKNSFGDCDFAVMCIMGRDNSFYARLRTRSAVGDLEQIIPVRVDMKENLDMVVNTAEWKATYKERVIVKEYSYSKDFNFHNYYQGRPVGDEGVDDYYSNYYKRNNRKEPKSDVKKWPSGQKITLELDLGEINDGDVAILCDGTITDATDYFGLGIAGEDLSDDIALSVINEVYDGAIAKNIVHILKGDGEPDMEFKLVAASGMNFWVEVDPVTGGLEYFDLLKEGVYPITLSELGTDDIIIRNPDADNSISVMSPVPKEALAKIKDAIGFGNSKRYKILDYNKIFLYVDKSDVDNDNKSIRDECGYWVEETDNVTDYLDKLIKEVS